MHSVDAGNIRVVRPGELTQAAIDRWRHLQDSDPSLSSPFFSPEFAQAVGLARRDAFVAVIEGDGTMGFFPFQRKGRVGKPIGAAICDYQGVILERGVRISARSLLDGCDLDVVDFNHVPAVQPLFRENSFIATSSPYLDVQGGYASYIARRKQGGTQEVHNTLRKLRKLEREVGPLRFVADDESSQAWQKLVEWKNAQYRRSHLVEVLGRTWVADTLATIRKQKSERFGGLLSTLYAGEHLLAVHFGLRSRTVWHYWFPAYDLAFQKYSPGLILLLKMAEHGPSVGIKMIDLGRGESRYKRAFADGEIALCEGSLERAASLIGALRRIRKKVEPAWVAMPVGSARTFSRRLFNRLIWRV